MSTTTAIKQAYKLRHNATHIADTSREYDAYVVQWPGFLDYGLKFKDVTNFEYPSHNVEFHGYESSLSDTDYPYNDIRWPIMSKRMLSTLLEVKDFPHCTWDVPFVGFPDNAPVMMLEQGLSGGIRHDNEFVAVQLLEHLDIFDWENSVYEMDSMFPDEVDRIRKLILKVPEEGLPPIFRLKVDPILLYVSPEGRAALEAANIKGVRFV
jgi:hypothetical protein